MNRTTRRQTGSLGEKGARKKDQTIYVPIGTGTAFSSQSLTRGRKIYENVVPGTGDGQHHDYGRTCVRRWVVMADGVLRSFRKRDDAMRAKKRDGLPKLVTL